MRRTAVGTLELKVSLSMKIYDVFKCLFKQTNFLNT